MKLLLSLLLLIQAVFAFKTFKGVIVADDSNFEDLIHTKGKYTFINFYSTGCEHCQKLGPRYEALATVFAGSDIQIAQLEGRKNRRVRNQENIVGYPTLRLYYFDGTHVASFSYRERSTEELARFLTEHTGVQPKWPESKVTELKGSDEVEKVITENKKRIVVGFAAPWLTNWSDRFNEFERLAEKFPDVTFYKLDATLEENAEIVSKYRVSVYPTLLYLDNMDAPRFRLLEEHEASQNKMEMFLRMELGDEYENLDDLIDEKSAGANDGVEKVRGYGFHKYSEDTEDDADEEERYKKLREL